MLLITAIALAIHSFFSHKKVYYLYLILTAITGVTNIAYLTVFNAGDFPVLSIFPNAMSAAFIVLSMVLMIHQVFMEEAVTADTLIGRICIYLLSPYLWTILYEIILAVNPDSFSSPLNSFHIFDLLYFSFTTLTTVGYGEITPVSQAARVFANLEAVFGVFPNFPL